MRFDIKLDIKLGVMAAILPIAFTYTVISTGTAQAQQTANKTGKPATSNASNIPVLGAARPLALPKVVEETLPNGLKLVLLEDHTQPAVWMQLALSAGSIRDPREKVGLASMTARMLTQGTTSYSEAQIADTVDGLGASLGASAGDDYLNVSARCLSNATDTLFHLMADVTLNPTFPDAELDRQRTQIINEVTSSLAEPATVANAAINRLVYGAHPYGNFSTGTPKTLNAITRDDLIKFHTTFFAPNQATLFLVGDITPDQARAKVLAAFGSWAKRDVPAAPQPPLRRAATASPTKPEITIIDRPGAAQTELRIGALTTGYADPKRVVGSVATAVLGLGQFEGRLTREIRVKRGLTYGAASFFSRKKDAGTFEISTFTKNASTAEVVKLALAEAQKISAEPIPADELKDRKTFLQGSFAVSVATPTGLLARLVPAVLYGGGPTDLTKYSSQVESATSAEIASIMRPLRLNAPKIVLVGDAKAIQKDVTPLGTVRIISADRMDLLAPDLEGGTNKPSSGTGTPTGSGTKATPAELLEGRARLESTIKAHGGDAFVNVRSIVLKGKGEVTDPTGQFPIALPVESLTITLLSPDKVLADLKAAFPIIIGTEGGDKGEWMTLMGQSQAAPAGVTNALNPAKLLRDAYVKQWPVAALPATDNAKEQGYIISTPDGKDIKVFVDATTHLANRAILPNQQGDVTLKTGNYKIVDGVQLPGTLQVVQKNVTFLDLTFNEIKINVPVDAKIFVKP